MRKENVFSDIDKNIAEHIRLRRIMLKMTQFDLANKCGLSFQQIQKYEALKNKISCSQLFQISQILEVPIEFFFENTDKMYKTESLKLLVLYWKLPKDIRKNLIVKFINYFK